MLLLANALIVCSSNAITFTSLTSGNWSSGSSWDQLGSIPSASDNVIIEDNHLITINSSQECNDLNINLGGELEVQSGASLNCYHNLLINEGTFTMIGGELNSGNAKSETFTNYGGTFNFSGGELNIAGRFRQYIATSVSSLSGSGIINVSTADAQTVSSRNNFEVTNGSFSVASGSSLQIILKNGNSTTKEEIYYSPQTSEFNGGSFIVENGTGLSDIYLDLDMPIYGLESKVGTSAILHLNSDCSFTLWELTITTGMLHVNVGAQISISNSLTTNDSLIINSTASGNGSLIPLGSVSGNVIVERYIQGYSSSIDGWHEISSPVDAMTIDGSDFDPSSNDDLYSWSENGNTWLNHKIPANDITEFTNGTGYLVSYENNITGQFVGSLNISDITYTNLSSGSGSGWHLLGNPFCSAISWNDGNWNLSGTAGVAKVWSESNGNYEDIDANENIPMSNGFFVQVTSGSNNIKIPASSRVHDNVVNNYKTDVCSMAETIDIKISNNQNHFSDETKVGFSADATYEWDSKFDSRKLYGNAMAPQLYTISMNEEFSTNYLPYDSQSVQLHLIPGTNGDFVLSFGNMKSFDVGASIFLEDRHTGNLVDVVKDSIYNFQALQGDPTDRFILHFYGITSLFDESSNSMNVYTNNDKIFIQVSPSVDQHKTIAIYDITGRLCYSKEVMTDKNISINNQFDNGVYIVVISMEERTIFRKIIIN